MMRRHFLAPIAIALSATAADAQQLLPSAGTERCSAAAANIGTATYWLDRSAATILPSTNDRILKFSVSHDVPLWEQSDRMYEPFIPNAPVTTRWFDLASRIEGRQDSARPLSGHQLPSQLFGEGGGYSTRDSTVALISPASVFSSALTNPWYVLSTWRAHVAHARVTQRCWYRDAWRVVLSRDGEKLYLSESDATPMKLERIEPHYLWGQVRAEYLWSTYWGVQGGGYYPNASFRLFDGAIYERVGVVRFHAELISRDSAPVLSIAMAKPMPPSRTPANSGTPDTIRVSSNTFLLVTPVYTQAVTLQRDTLFLFDATTSEARARQDSIWVAKLFPGKHPVVLVVTDLAWPHISGVRFWVARGAIIVSSRESEDFLKRVVTRRWTLAPDALEKARATAHFRFRPVTDSLRLAGGAIVVHALQNTSTETAVGAWIAGDKFLWAGDYIQGDPSSPYVRDVVATVRALGLHPDKVSAQHIKLSDWVTYEQLFPQQPSKH